MATVKTALVLAGGGSLGAVQVGMLQALVEDGIRFDLVVGASVGPSMVRISQPGRMRRGSLSSLTSGGVCERRMCFHFL